VSRSIEIARDPHRQRDRVSDGLLLERARDPHRQCDRVSDGLLLEITVAPQAGDELVKDYVYECFGTGFVRQLRFH
jgi:hypothetical protein